MCRYTQVVIVTHRGPVIPCRCLMFRSRFIQLVDFCHYCATLLCFDTRIPRCHSHNFGEPLVFNNINRSTVFSNPFGICASQLVTGRLNEGPTLFSEGGLAHSTLTPHASRR